MNKKTQSKLVTAAKEVLATFCWKDESGCFYEEIYADYRDELDDGSLKKICALKDKIKCDLNCAKCPGKGIRELRRITHIEE